MSNKQLKNNYFSKNEENDMSIDVMLRPASFSEYIGQSRIKQNIKTMINAAKQRNESIDHLLFFGQAGLGKTTLASIIAKEMNASIKITSGPILERAGDVVSILSTLNNGDILFIDEVHRLNRNIEEILYPAMESRKLHLIIGKGPSARMLNINLPQFTIIAATTRANLLSSPFRSRFGAVFKLDYYKKSDIEKIIERSASILGIKIEKNAVNTIASASRFTPRIANRLLKRVRDVAQVRNEIIINKSIAEDALRMFNIDNLGLEEHDRKLLRIISERFNGGPVGLSTLSAALGEDKGIIEGVYEPYLIKIGLLERTQKGRIVTKKYYNYIKKNKFNI